ncbi:hypothetical protein [Glycomyces artemisiae]|uniref:Excreted virulence factor EspC (Type VII ESX diderm) n=1 Tax=Glycomyces artemisiae TaxID=1076443 RepID=A0A2T0UT74_9ACTN|nr:hypothetical protein [Glycomyces artemisiae]PRY61131.1 hypothetical protein B0I28_102751 [Glycomyces artemisiae]
METESSSGGFQVETADLETVAEYLAGIADFYDQQTTAVGLAAKSCNAGLFTSGAAAGGNALAEELLNWHQFVYQVLEESADGIRAAGRMITEAKIDYESTDEEVSAAFTAQESEVDSGNYTSGQPAPTDFEEYEVTGTADERRGADMTEYYSDQLGSE